MTGVLYIVFAVFVVIFGLLSLAQAILGAISLTILGFNWLTLSLVIISALISVMLFTGLSFLIRLIRRAFR